MAQSDICLDLDESVLHDMCDSDIEFENDLLNTFIGCQDPALVELAVAIERRDFETVKKIAHFTKGGAKSIGGQRLARVSELLEQTVASGKLSEAIELASEMLRAYNDLKHTILARSNA